MTPPMPEHGEPVGSSSPFAGQHGHTCIFNNDMPNHLECFVGRKQQLELLRKELGPGDGPAAKRSLSVLFGTEGIGKSQLAAEYAYQHQDEYWLVWWVQASDEDSMLASLFALGRDHLMLTDLSKNESDRSLAAIHSALQASDRGKTWLLIFNDVTRPETLRRYLPPGNGHVIVTSYISEWRGVLGTEGIEVPPLGPEDAIEFLRMRVPELAQDPGDDDELAAGKIARSARLAETVGYLPLAAEHAASYIEQEQVGVSCYIDQFNKDALTLLSRDPDSYANGTVATTVTLAQESLSDEAAIFFRFLACFAPEPIEERLLDGYASLSPKPAVPRELDRVLASRDNLRDAERELTRFSLISRPRGRKTIVMNRVVQRVTRARTERNDSDVAPVLRELVLALLVRADPGDPDLQQNDAKYQVCYPHLIEARATESNDRQVRSLVKNQVRQLWLWGCYPDARSLGEAARSAWGVGPDKTDQDKFDALAVSIEVAIVLRMLGLTDEANRLNEETQTSLLNLVGSVAKTDEKYKDYFSAYLRCANSHGEDLRQLGRYEGALKHDHELVTPYRETYGDDGYRTSNLRNNIAIDLRGLGQYEEALGYDTEAAEERERDPDYGPKSPQALSSKYGMASSLRRLGRFEDALAVSDKLAAIVNERGDRPSLLGLYVLGGHSVSLRLVGRSAEAHALAERVYDQCREDYGEKHRVTLLTATNLMCDRRLAEDFAGAQALGEATVAAWDEVTGDKGHPNGLISRVNLAVILQMRRSYVDARKLNEEALAGFDAVFAQPHPYRVIVRTNLATVLFHEGNVRAARKLDEEAVGLCTGPLVTAHLDDIHPIILAANANLAIDMQATDDDKAAGLALAADTLAKLRQHLPAGHPLIERAVQHDRLNIDIEPTTL